MLTVGEAFSKFKSWLEMTAIKEEVASRRREALRGHVESEITANRAFLMTRGESCTTKHG